MAYPEISSKGATHVYWQMKDLTFPFTSTYYYTVGLTTEPFTEGGHTLPGGIWSNTDVYNGEYFTYGALKTGLSPNTTYGLYGYEYRRDLKYYRAGYVSFKTDTLGTLSTPIRSSWSATSTSMTVTCSAVTNATHYEFAWSSGINIDDYGTSRTRTVTGLTPNTEYGVQFRAYASGYTPSSWSIPYWEYTLVLTRPSNWAWSTTVLNAIAEKTAFSNLTVTEWNNFLTRVNDFCTYKQVTLLSSSIFRTSQNNILYASDMRTIGNKIYSMGGGVAPEIRDSNIVYSGANVLGWYFTNLAAALNQIQ